MKISIVKVFALFVAFFAFALPQTTDAPTDVPSPSPTPVPTTTAVPSFKPTAKPSNKPSQKPTRAPTPHIYPESNPVKITIPDQQLATGILTITVFVGMVAEVLSPEVIFLIAVVLLMLTEILSLTDTLSGFSNESMITIGALFLVVGGVEKSHLVDWAARLTFGSEGSVVLGKARMYCSSFALSCFFNNTPLVAMLMPVVRDWARIRGQSAAQLLMPMNYAVLCGSFGSMIGTSTNLTVQGLMQADRNFSFSFFAPLPVGITCFAIVCVYMLFFAQYLLPNNKSGLIREMRDRAENLVAEVYVSEHSVMIGKTLQSFMNSLGIAPSSAIKIRRRVGVSHEDLAVERKSFSAKILDKKYLKETANFWFQRPSIPDRVNSYAPTNGDDAAEDPEAGSKTVGEPADKPEEGEYEDIVAPRHNEIIGPHDIVFISSAVDVVAKLMKSVGGESHGLYLLKSNALALPGFGSELLEVVISDTNPFLGIKVGDLAERFANEYKLGLITVRPKEWNEDLVKPKRESIDAITPLEKEALTATATANAGDVELTERSAKNSDEENGDKSKTAESSPEQLEKIRKLAISEHPLACGDIVLAVGKSDQIEGLQHNRDFFVVSTVGALPKPITLWKSIPAVIFLVMLCVVASSNIDMCPAALTVAVVFFIGGWIKPKEIPEMVDIRLLLLMGCAISFAKAMSKTGLAVRIAQQINEANPTPMGALLLIYALNCVISELITNNAAAGLMYPIGVALADEMGVDFKPFAMAVMIASTAGFMIPTGYQTHVMIWGPGGYNFKDFVIFGFFPDVVYWLVGCAIIVRVYPF